MKRQQGALDRSVLGAGTRERARLNRRRHHGVALPAIAISWKAWPAQERGLGSHARRATVASAIPNARRSHNLCYINGLWVSRQKLARTRTGGPRCRARPCRQILRADSPSKALGNRATEGYSSSKASRSEEHTSELQSLRHIVCRLLLEK